MIRFKKIKTDIYRQRIVFVESDNANEVSEKFDLKYEDGEELFAHAHWNKIREKGVDFNCYFIVANKNNSYSKFGYGTLAHECIHIANYIFSHLGIAHDPNNDEPFAYLVEHIYEEALKFYGELNLTI